MTASEASGESYPVQLGVGDRPLMAIVSPRTKAADEELRAMGETSKGVVVAEDITSITYAAIVTSEVLAAIDSSDAGLVGMTHGSLAARGESRAAMLRMTRTPPSSSKMIAKIEDDVEDRSLPRRIDIEASERRGSTKTISSLVSGKQRPDSVRTATYDSITNKEAIMRTEAKVANRMEMVDRMIAEIMEKKGRPEHSEPFDIADDIEIAERTVLLTATEFEDQEHRMVFAAGRFWRYDNMFGVWQRFEKEEMKRVLMNVWGRHPRYTKNGTAPISVSDSKLNGVLNVFKTKINDPLFFAGSHLFGVGMRNGLLTVLDGEITLIEKHPNWRCSSYIDADYTGHDDCPMWKKYLDEVMEPARTEGMSDEEYAAEVEDADKKKKLLAEFVGGCVLGNVWERQKCLVLYGTGGNGKSVFTSVISRLFDENSISALSPQDWKDRFRLMLLLTSRVNIVSELPERDITEGERFKAIVSGERITAERKYEDAVEASVKAGHIFSCNALPHATDASSGFWRRFLIVTFNNRFDDKKERVIALDDKIVKNELAGVARWALEGAIRLAKNDTFTIPKDTADRLSEWRDASDVIKSFLTSAASDYDPPPDAKKNRQTWTAASDVYKVYAFWCKANGHQPMSSTKFGTKAKLYVAHKKTKAETSYAMVFKPEYRSILRGPV